MMSIHLVSYPEEIYYREGAAHILPYRVPRGVAAFLLAAGRQWWHRRLKVRELRRHHGLLFPRALSAAEGAAWPTPDAVRRHRHDFYSHSMTVKQD